MSTISKPFTFSAGATIIASEHNSNFDTIINDYNGNITNANISGSAAIGAAKLNLSTIAQDIEFTGTLDFSGATITEETAFADIDVNGGTIDGAAIGAASPSTGHFTELSLGSGVAVISIKDEDNMASDSATALATQQSIKAYADSLAKSNVLFIWGFNSDYASNDYGVIYGVTTDTPAITGATGRMMFLNDTTTARAFLRTKWTKVASVSTVTVRTRAWTNSNGGSDSAIVAADIGGATGTVTGTVDLNGTPEWVSFTVDVSGLSNGTTYDAVFTLTHDGTVGSDIAYLDQMIGMGS